MIERFCRADVVFVGEVESTLNVRGRIIETKLWPRRTFKGRTSSPAYALDAQLELTQGMACDFDFSPLEAYLIFAEFIGETGYLCVSSCDLSQRLDENNQVFRTVANLTDAAELCSEDASAERQTALRKAGRDAWLRHLSVPEDVVRETREQAAGQTGEADNGSMDQ